MKYKVGIDARLFSKTGVGTYIRNLLYYLAVADVSNTIFYIYMLPQDVQKMGTIPPHFIVKKAPYNWRYFFD